MGLGVVVVVRGLLAFNVLTHQHPPPLLAWTTRLVGSLEKKRRVKYSSKSHLSKLPSDLKQTGTQEKTKFSGTVFQTLSHGVFVFVASVSFKNH